ncbi:MAG TPA: PfkB family carbohydrate kinase [Solirubrobacteraceae bacterium]|nr:PfkB family carbohydrate kinase [Solirubrobacteraceae bacterium]
MGGAMILVVGDVMDDVVVRPRGDVAADSDTPSDIESRPGGSGANVAAWLGHLGAPVRFAARVASADVARHAAALAACGVDARLQGDEDAPTGRVVVIAGRDTRAMFTDRGASARLTELSEALLHGITWLHVSGYQLFAPASRTAALALARVAAEHGIGRSVDPNSESFLRALGAGVFLDATDGFELCFANAEEADVLGGPEALVRRYEVAAVKRGRAGAVLHRRDAPPLEVPGEAADAVDPTGAGDAFAAGFLAARLRGEDDAACARAAVRAAAAVVTRAGGRPA